MTSFSRAVFRYIALGLLYLLASPLYAVLGIAKLVRLFRIRALLARGEITCPHCAKPNPLFRLATCRACGSAEYGSLLHCGNCGEITSSLPCASCGTTIRVL